MSDDHPDLRLGPAWSGPTCCGKPVGCMITDGCIMTNHPWKQAHPRDEHSAAAWDAPDGTRWMYFRQYGQWHGWQPGEDGLWIYTPDRFRRSYPDAPDWDEQVL
jgi:hypothetical protein